MYDVWNYFKQFGFCFIIFILIFICFLFYNIYKQLRSLFMIFHIKFKLQKKKNQIKLLIYINNYVS
jgi:hypothetical protein